MTPRALARLIGLSALWQGSLVFAAEHTSVESGAKPIPQEFAGLRERWVAGMEEFFVPGFAVAVVRNDEVIYLDTFGYRDIEKKLPVTPDTSYYIASATKPFTAMGVMKLVEEGKVKLDDPVKKHLPRFDLPDSALADRATIRDLLSHKAGINCGPAVFLDAYTGEITDDRYFRFLKQHAEMAGETSYSNIHYTLAGRVIEAVSGKPWRDYLAFAVFEPTGLKTATGYADAMYARADVALPYELDDAGLSLSKVRKNDATMHAAGGLGISISDFARWVRLNINRGEIEGKRIISDASAAEMQSVQAEQQDGRIRVQHGFGLAWNVGTFRPGGPRYLMHSGGYIGASAHSSFLPDQKIGVVVLTNVSAPGAVFAESVVSIDILDRLIGGQHPDFMEQLRTGMATRLPQMRANAAKTKVRTPVSAPEAVSLSPELYAGTYENADFGTVRIRRESDTLTMSVGTLPLALIECEKDAFVVFAAGDRRAGRFEIASGKVTAVVLDLEIGDVRFARQER